MATMMRCTQSHWQGNTLIRAGDMRPKGHAEVIDQFFEPFELDVGDAEPKRTRATTKRSTAK